MTPKEKAKYLVNKSMPLAHDWESDNEVVAIKIALLCVNEILDTKPLEKDYEDHGHRGREVWYNDKTDYWLNVKLEISLL